MRGRLTAVWDCLSYSLPAQKIILEPSLHSAGIFQPGEVGADCAANQHILLIGHGERIPGKEPLQDLLKTEGLPADFLNLIRHLVHFGDIAVRQRNDVLRSFRMGWNKIPGRQRFDPLQGV